MSGSLLNIHHLGSIKRRQAARALLSTHQTNLVSLNFQLGGHHVTAYKTMNSGLKGVWNHYFLHNHVLS
jgi:hypothetical protein